jgi:sugar phosphate permease
MKANHNVDGVHMHLENKKISRNFFWLVWVLYAVVYMTKNCYSAAMAAIVNEGILTKSQTGLISAVFYGVYAPLQILGGVFADKYNPERMIKIGLVGSGIANLIIFFNQNYYVMLIVWILNAVVQFGLWPSVFKIISSQLEPGYRTKGVYFISFASIFGLILAYVVAAFVTKWQYNFIISSVLLFAFAIIFHIVDVSVEKHMVPDPRPRPTNVPTKQESEGSTWKLFLSSGFCLLMVVTLLRTITSQGIRTLTSTFLMESYDSISPSVGNLLNTLIIIAGVLGVIGVNQFIYPRLIRNEVLATLILVGISIVPVGMLLLAGKASAIVIMIALFISALLLTPLDMLMVHFAAAFAKYGKNGSAVGTNNSFASIAIMIQSYGLVAIADHSGWNMVIYLWIILLIVSVILLIVAQPLWTKFKKGK